MSVMAANRVPILRSLLITFRRHVHHRDALGTPDDRRQAQPPKRLDVYSLAGAYRSQSARQAACRSRSK